MTRFSATAIGCLATVAVLLACGRLAAAEDARMVLCGAEKDGVGSFAAGPIERLAKDAGLDIEIEPDPMPKVNLMKLADGACDAAIVQLDTLLLYKAEHMSGQLLVAAPLYLFDKYLHLVCRRESGIETVDDLLRNPQRYKLLIGEPGSGSAMTWKALTKLDMHYHKVATRAVGGADALAALTAGEDADCLVHTDGIGTAFMTQVEAAGAGLRLVPLDLFQLRDAEMVENSVYRAAVIPPETYAQLQTGLAGEALETIAVGTMLVTDRAWAGAHPEQHQALIRAVAAARDRLFESAGQ